MNNNTSRHSNTQVKSAGDRISKETASNADWAVLEEFRNSHAYVLNTFRPTLTRHISNRRNTIFVQRLKRKSTIIDKLLTGRAKDLSTMHDLAGCRLIFDSVSNLEKYRNKLHSSRFKHQRIHNDKYDYIKSPKKTGYRGIHDVYKYKVLSTGGSRYNGLFIEIQYRTRIQHAWATAVEISDFINKTRVKFDRGASPKRERFFVLASEYLARTYEDLAGPAPEISTADLMKELKKLEHELGVVQGLMALHEERVEMPNSMNVVLHFHKNSLGAKGFRSASQAITFRDEIERIHPDDDVVYVRGKNSSEIRTAFRNYFRNSKEFVRLIEPAV